MFIIFKSNGYFQVYFRAKETYLAVLNGKV